MAARINPGINWKAHGMEKPERKGMGEHEQEWFDSNKDELGRVAFGDIEGPEMDAWDEARRKDGKY